MVFSARLWRLASSAPLFFPSTAADAAGTKHRAESETSLLTESFGTFAICVIMSFPHKHGWSLEKGPGVGGTLFHK